MDRLALARPRTPVAGARTLAALFREQARTTPAALAVEDGRTRLSYAALDARSDALARRLRAAGVGPESRVGLAMERSAEMVVALLAIVKAGGAYVPLDPAYPADRLAFMQEDAGVQVLVAEGALPAALSSFAGTVVSTLRDEDAEDGDAAGHREPVAGPGEEGPADPDRLAYVVYTSGSTGRPKGIAVTHRGVVRLVRGADYVRLGPGDRVAQLAPTSFDAATFEVWGPLLNGGAVVVLPREAALSPRALEDALARGRIGTLFLTTALFQGVARERPAAFSGVGQLLFGGEACDPAAVRRVLEAGGPGRLVHVYGPTESTTFATWHPVSHVAEDAAVVPIGGPVAGTAARVLDGRMRPAAPGAPGELFLGGAGLARGYLNRPGLTAERFVPDPFATEPGARLYRTGDRVRLDGAGALEFLGRTDDQVKIRGHRVEPREVEGVLLRHPGVRDAAVVARRDATGELRLVAYVVPEAGGPSSGELRAWVAERLPAYLRPAAWAALPALPLGPSGKVDRRALPEPPQHGGQPEDAPGGEAPPATPTEAALAGIWAEVLGQPRVGRGDDFYELGGHSLRAAQVCARVRERLGVEVSPVRVLEDARTVADLARVVDEAGGEAGAEWRIPPAPRDGPLPLSFAQEAVWFFQKVSPGLRSYHFQATLDLHGTLDVEALEGALTELVRRHEILRTTFTEDEEGRPAQTVHQPWRVRLPVRDLRSVPAHAREEEAGRVLREDFAHPFDLAALPLVRWTLLRLDDEHHRLAQVEHHFVHDGWSFTVLLRETFAAYASLAAGARPEPGPPPLQFADYAAWQRAWVRGPRAAAQLDFWRRTLAGAPPVLELPFDRPRPPEITFRGGSLRIALPPRLVGAARAFGAARGVSLYAVLLAAFQGVLHRWSGQDDFVVGGSVANRGTRELEGMIGMVVNTVALRADLAGDPDFATLAERARRTVLDAQANGEVPFDRVVEAVRPERTLSHLPLYQVLFSFHQAPMPPLELPGLSVRVTEGHGNGSAKFDLSVVLIPRQQGEGADGEGSVEAIWEFNRDLFDESTVRRLARHFERLLERALAAPGLPVSAHPLDDGDASAAVLDGGAVPEPARCIHHLFEAQAAATPERVAVAHGAGSLTYAELDREAGRLARRLRARGVGPETRVGVCVDRRPEMLVALLGVLKAGGAYVPLDPALPAARLAWMLEDTEAALVVAHSAVADRLPASRAAVVLVDAEDDEADADVEADARPEAGGAADAGASPENLAYVLYTSGSTGRPKGVMVRHAGVAARLAWYRDTVPQAEREGALASTSLSFDVSVVELFGPLCAGGTLVLVENALDLASLPRDAGVTMASMVPGAAAELLRAGAFPPSLRALALAGEALPAALARGVFERTAVRRLRNLYGPTEDSVYSTAAEVEPGAARVPIGRPLPGTGARVLDARLRPVPEGVPGELCLAGVGLARGYLGRPGLTAERFVPDPFSPGPGGRMYRTGDRVRMAAGELEYLGRLDAQVKVRGVRVEPGEVEAALLSVAGVAECAVAAHRDEGGRTRLVAYLAAAPGAELPSAASLRAALRERLPEAMVPSAFVPVPALPRTGSGKVDRRALPRPAFAAPGAAEEGFTAPRDAREAALAGVWRELLGAGSVGVHDNFFDLGGDSILALQVVARAARAGIRLTPRQVFRHPTIAGLAACPEEAAAPVPAAAPDGAPLTPIQRWLLEGETAQVHHWNQAVLLELARPVEGELLERALHHLVRHHDALRLRFRRGEDGWRQEHAPREEARLLAVVAPPAEDAGDAEAWERAAAGAVAGAHAGLDLERGPMLRGVLLRPGGGRPDRLVLVAHHLVVDAVSWRVLRDDLETLCRAAAEEEPLPQLARTTPFAQWAARLAEHAASVSVAAELPRWEEECAADGTLPVDLPAGADLEGGVLTHTLTLSAEETAALLRDAPRRHHARTEDLLLAALGRVLCRWTGRGAVTVDVEGHGREPIFADVDLSRTVGWFTSLFPLRLEAGGAGSSQAVEAVRDRLRRIPRRGIGYGLLRHLSPDATARRRLAAPAAPALLFNYLGRLDPPGTEAPLFIPVPGDAGAPRSPLAPRRHRLEVTARVLGGSLHVTWRYGGDVYAHETIARLADEMGGELRALLHGPAAAEPAREEVEEVYPLTPVQEGILFHARGGGAGLYLVQAVWDLTGELDPAVLRRAWDETAAAHPVLRTRFARTGRGTAVQEVLRRAPVPLETHNWPPAGGAGDGEDSPDAGRRFDTWLAADRERGLDLEGGAPVRLALFRQGPRRHRLVVTFHHALLDGWSHTLLLREVLARCGGAVEAGPAPGAPTFRDYVEWLAGRHPEEGQAFWRGMLQGYTAPEALPLERAPGRAAAGAAGERADLLDPAATEALAAFGRQHRVTLATLVQAAWALTLARLGGREDVVFGVVDAGRPPELPGIEHALGPFASTRPARALADPAAPLLPWLRGLQEQQAEARHHAHVPLVRIAEWSGVAPTAPLFETLAAFENHPLPRAEGADERGVGDADLDPRLRLGGVRSHGRLNYPLALVARPGERLSLRLIFDGARVDEDAAERMLAHVRGLLEALPAAAPLSPLRELRPAAEAAETGRILREWSGQAPAYPRDAGIAALFHEQVARAPGAVALWSAEVGELTYAELDARAARLSRRLRAAGVGPESRVGVSVERSAGMVVALLAILKAGGAYVPLDPSYPPDRLAFMLEDAGVEVLVVGREVPAALATFGGTVVSLAALAEAEEAMEGEEDGPGAPGPVGGADALAYVCYTSGSTGRPKGVAVPQRAVVRLVRGADYFHVDPDEVFLQFAPLGFDPSAFEIWGALLNGARLVMGPPRTPTLEELGAFIHDHGITTMWLTAGLFHPMAESQREAFRGVRQLLAGGDVLSPAHCRRMVEAYPALRLVNGYGPTENGTFTTCHAIEPEDVHGAPVPIGRPIANTRTYVLDAGLCPVPAGVPGELWTGGDGLARGYVNRAAATAERFFPDPFSPQPGGRMYRTGDRARWRPDGTLEFLGRVDQQVKIRGFRVEPGEVETALRAHPAVEDAVVVPRPDARGEKRLVAWVVGRGGTAADAGELRAWLRGRLPEHMVPSAMVALPAFPLNPSGKVDRHALPDPAPEREERAHVAPRNQTEADLAAIFAEVLGVREVGVEDDFFALGGHSLRAMQVLGRVGEQMGVQLPLGALFERPTVAGLAGRMQEMEAERIAALLAEIETLSDADARLLLEGGGGAA